jgi:hypothetical protein
MSNIGQKLEFFENSALSQQPDHQVAGIGAK